MIHSLHGGFLTPEHPSRATNDFLQDKEQRPGNDSITSCTIKTLVQSTWQIEDILNIDGVYLDYSQIVGRIVDLNYRVSKQRTGDIPYKELTINDDSGIVHIQIFKNDETIDLFDQLLKSTNQFGDPRVILTGLYVQAVVKPQQNETQKKWKYFCKFIEIIRDFNVITHHNLRVITTHLERSKGILQDIPMEFNYQQIIKQQQTAHIQQNQIKFLQEEKEMIDDDDEFMQKFLQDNESQNLVQQLIKNNDDERSMKKQYIESVSQDKLITPQQDSNAFPRQINSSSLPNSLKMLLEETDKKLSDNILSLSSENTSEIDVMKFLEQQNQINE